MDVSKARTEVVEGFIGIETWLNVLISTYYFGGERGQFILEVLYDEHCSFGMRLSVLKKILRKLFVGGSCDTDINQKVQELYELNNIRNIFAHCGPDVLKWPDGTVIRYTPDPRNPTQPLDFGSKYERFKKLQPEVSTWLNSLRFKIDEYLYRTEGK